MNGGFLVIKFSFNRNKSGRSSQSLLTILPWGRILDMFILSSQKPGQKARAAVVLTGEGEKGDNLEARHCMGKDAGYVHFEQPEVWSNCAAAGPSGEGGPKVKIFVAILEPVTVC
ncbi:uncharacterized protein [Aristolochia californica]|uniref:uncharacterized protein isoform X3 n=1 Tax=Aristolochia californica TaxID=171875 RepID=UPI0035D97CA4